MHAPEVRQRNECHSPANHSSADPVHGKAETQSGTINAQLFIRLCRPIFDRKTTGFFFRPIAWGVGRFSPEARSSDRFCPTPLVNVRGSSSKNVR
jgi:hypothetical protein